MLYRLLAARRRAQPPRSRCAPARLAAVFALAWAASLAAAQQDPPGRVGRINHAEGSVAFAPAGDDEWVEAPASRPLVRGDRLWTDRGSRVELHVGSTAVRLDGQTRLSFGALDDHAVQLDVTQGTAALHVRHLLEGERLELDTPNLALRAMQPGAYRVDVDAVRGTTRVTVQSGVAVAYGENGENVPLGAGQQIVFRSRTLAEVQRQESPPEDALDRWAAERNRREDQSIAARYLPRELTGYPQLDVHGTWSQDAQQGWVWWPRTAAGWVPYRFGRWDWIAPWGWTWIDDAPWAFATSHYGRWMLSGGRWGWVPGRLAARPVYAPALVGFLGSGADGVNWNLQVAGKPAVAWYPLAPGEAWRPAYRASGAYMANVNRQHAGTGHAFQKRSEAVSAVSAEDFHRGRPVQSAGLRLSHFDLARAQAVAPPAVPQQGGVVAQRPRPEPARAGPPAAAPQPPVIVAAEVRPRAAPAVLPATAPPTPAPPVAAATPSRPAGAVREASVVRKPAARAHDVRREEARREEARREAVRQEQARAEQARRDLAAREKEKVQKEAALRRTEAQRLALQRHQMLQQRVAERQRAEQERQKRLAAEEQRAERERQQRLEALRIQAQREEYLHRDQRSVPQRAQSLPQPYLPVPVTLPAPQVGVPIRGMR